MDLNLRSRSLTQSRRQPILRFGLWLCAVLLPFAALGQDANVGKSLYNTPLVSGQLSCGAGACHGPDPLARQNRIQNGDEPGGIGFAINTVTQMAFLRGQTTAAQLIDIAAYIADPAAATGSPAAQLSASQLTFADTIVGQASSAHVVNVTNTGTLHLNIVTVTTTSADFAASTNCASVAVGATCAILVTFTPSVSGARIATLNLTHNAPGGISSVALGGTAIAARPVTQVSPNAIDFGEVGLSFFSEVRTVTLSNTGNSPLLLNAVTLVGEDFAREGGTCAAGLSIAPSQSCSVGLRFIPSVEGPANGTLRLSHDAAPPATEVSLAGLGIRATPETRLMTEYRYAPLNYYFVTSRDADKTLLDQASGFERTGLQFKVFALHERDTHGITRYYFDKAALNGARGTHFYTLLDSEKTLLAALNPDNNLAPVKPYNEGIDSYAYLPLQAGVGGFCDAGQVPVYRIFRGNTRFPDDPNHRFTSSVAVYQSMVAAGWDDEGVKFCAPE